MFAREIQRMYTKMDDGYAIRIVSREKACSSKTIITQTSEWKVTMIAWKQLVKWQIAIRKLSTSLQRVLFVYEGVTPLAIGGENNE